MSLRLRSLEHASEKISDEDELVAMGMKRQSL